MNSITLVKEMSDYIKNIKKRQSEISEIVKNHSMRNFDHSKASIRDIRVEALRKNLENCYNQD